MVRLSRNLRMINIESRLPALKEYFAGNPDIIAAYLYGSYDTSAQTVLSDVDLGILLREGIKDRFDLYLAIQSAVIEVTREEDVNVLILNDAPVIIQYEVIATGRLLYERSADTHLDFIERVLKRYPDFALDFRAFCAEYDQSLREAYLRGQQE
ncbi:type VII toxin-antitoxin system MntA family adenylyltransferase antitoxin [Candidatus Desulforudis audaxviator]|uniref:DNA polymerase, beta domain protein region n=1 Tax=Desulforudis audaxviator (strain MP104C) TaxID=477974 RepID=B1I5A9_DESAP|nr:nucleotidyltransferase domain-containing protein [Candidatus Desulforudis audaxviator]ACA60178.1 DNA polymerase, beta domain protein region [Candidatus Desulforudis audaxviator MP104C]AZK60218.1 DNA polymerase, beta domain protein region [Candidatus Desulforudis audaxviator]